MEKVVVFVCFDLRNITSSGVSSVHHPPFSSIHVLPFHSKVLPGAALFLSSLSQTRPGLEVGTGQMFMWKCPGTWPKSTISVLRG